MAIIGAIDILLRGDNKQLDASFSKSGQAINKFAGDAAKGCDKAEHATSGLYRSERALGHGVESLGKALSTVNPALGETISKMGESLKVAGMAEHSYHAYKQILDATKASTIALNAVSGIGLLAVVGAAAAIAYGFAAAHEGMEKALTTAEKLKNSFRELWAEQDKRREREAEISGMGSEEQLKAREHDYRESLKNLQKMKDEAERKRIESKAAAEPLNAAMAGRGEEGNRSGSLTKFAYDLIGGEALDTTKLLKEKTEAEEAYRQSLVKVKIAEDNVNESQRAMMEAKGPAEQAKAAKANETALDRANKAYEKLIEKGVELTANPLDEITGNMLAVRAALDAGRISQEKYNAAMDKAKEKFGITINPLQQYQDKLGELTEAWKRSNRSVEEYWDTVQKLQKSELGIDKSPKQKIEEWQKKSQAIAAQGNVGQWEKYKAVMDSAPNYVRSIIESTRTPLEKFSEKIQELQQWKGLIPDDLFKRATANLKKDLLGIDFSPAQQIEDWKKKSQAIAAQEGGQWEKYKATMASAPDYVRSIIESTRTPLEKFNEKMKELQAWKGLIPDDLFKRAAANLRKDLLGTEPKFAGLAERGSKEARSSILNWKYQRDPNDPNIQLVNITRVHLAESQKQTQILSRISGDGSEIMSLPGSR